MATAQLEMPACILGMGKVGAAVKILLDIGRVLSSDDLEQIAAISTNEEM